jgi:hypothetical protein
MTADRSFGTRSWLTWPLWGLAAVVLIEARGLVTTPEISESHMRTLPPTIANQFTGHKSDLLVGGAVVGGATVVGYSALAMTAQAADERVTVPTYAAIQATTDGLAYAAFTAMAIVTGAVAAAGLRSAVVPRWLSVFSALATVTLLAAAFLPFVSWFPALIWTLVTSLTMLAVARPNIHVLDAAQHDSATVSRPHPGLG